MRQIRNEFKAGIFILSALILFIGSIFVIGREKQLFSKQYEYFASFNDVKGLTEGAPIKLGGITIGRVDAIDFSENTGDNAVIAKLSVNEKFINRLKEDSKVAIMTQGLLGDKYIHISNGSAPQSLAPGSKITVNSHKDITNIIESVSQITSKVEESAEHLDKTIHLLNDDIFKKAGSFLEQLNTIASDVKNGEGVLHSLVYSKEISESTKLVIHSLAALFNPEASKNGTASNTLLSSFSATVHTFHEILKEIKNGKGVLHNLVYNDTDNEVVRLINSLTLTTEHLKRVSEGLASGNGTLGALLLDSSLYDNLIETTDKAKRSFLLRQAIKHTLQ
jgi:phospholipid/cholesterol/gamma-HCH transport system substrate-binding protein